MSTVTTVSKLTPFGSRERTKISLPNESLETHCTTEDGI